VQTRTGFGYRRHAAYELWGSVRVGGRFALLKFVGANFGGS